MNVICMSTVDTNTIHIQDNQTVKNCMISFSFQNIDYYNQIIKGQTSPNIMEILPEFLHLDRQSHRECNYASQGSEFIGSNLLRYTPHSLQKIKNFNLWSPILYAKGKISHSKQACKFHHLHTHQSQTEEYLSSSTLTVLCTLNNSREIQQLQVLNENSNS